jgi:uncharacterized iron-regulated membrane protein
MKRLRSILFWLHLSAGVVAGVVILIMSLTGVLLAFKPQIQRFVDRDVRIVQPPGEGAARVGVRHMVANVRLAKPEGQLQSIAVESDPTLTAAVSLGREATIYVDPYSGRVLGEGSRSLQVSFRWLEDWHRWLGVSTENRAAGKALTGPSNLAFLLLAISGMYLWWPRKWLPQHVTAILKFRRQATGRARDFNWHNVIGFWCAPVLVVLTASGVVMSYPWANNLVYQLTGSPLPQAAGAGRAGGPGGAGRAGAPDRARDAVSLPDNLDQLWTRAEQQVPQWRSITMRLPDRAGAPVAFTITDATQWNAFARSQLTLDSASAEIIRWEPYANNSLGQKVRGWLRFAHTGELGGIAGQTVAGVACLGGVVLVWTGLSLAWRRLLGWIGRKRSTGERTRSDEAAA